MVEAFLLVTFASLALTTASDLFQERECGVYMGGGDCGAEPCRSDDDCQQETVCCYNGCKNTCLPPIAPPPAFDWTEETPDLVRPIRGHKGEEQEQTMRGETVVLQGGCLITKGQLATLEDFSNNSHVHTCFCNQGGIYCQIVQ